MSLWLLLEGWLLLLLLEGWLLLLLLSLLLSVEGWLLSLLLLVVARSLLLALASSPGLVAGACPRSVHCLSSSVLGSGDFRVIIVIVAVGAVS